MTANDAVKFVKMYKGRKVRLYDKNGYGSKPCDRNGNSYIGIVRTWYEDQIFDYVVISVDDKIYKRLPDEIDLIDDGPLPLPG